MKLIAKQNGLSLYETKNRRFELVPSSGKKKPLITESSKLKSKTIFRLIAILSKEFYISKNLVEQVNEVVSNTWLNKNKKFHKNYEWNCLREIYQNIC